LFNISFYCFGVIEHLGPVVSLVDGFVSEGSTPTWFLQSPSWISCITLLASSGLRHLKYGSSCSL